jgi:hypothetical protein
VSIEATDRRSAESSVSVDLVVAALSSVAPAGELAAGRYSEPPCPLQTDADADAALPELPAVLPARDLGAPRPVASVTTSPSALGLPSSEPASVWGNPPAPETVRRCSMPMLARSLRFFSLAARFPLERYFARHSRIFRESSMSWAASCHGMGTGRRYTLCDGSPRLSAPGNQSWQVDSGTQLAT